MSVDFVNLSMTRRKLIKGAACSAAAASAPSLVNHAFAEQIAKLEKEGWSKHPVACTMCGAYCGILAMRKEGEPISEKTVRIFPTPGHPQQGYCGRSAGAMWASPPTKGLSCHWRSAGGGVRAPSKWLSNPCVSRTLNRRGCRQGRRISGDPSARCSRRAYSRSPSSGRRCCRPARRGWWHYHCCYPCRARRYSLIAA